MPRTELDLNPVQHITADAIGQPGKRVFYLQGWRESDVHPVTIIIEKIQLQTLATGLEQILTEISSKDSSESTSEEQYDEEKNAHRSAGGPALQGR